MAKTVPVFVFSAIVAAAVAAAKSEGAFVRSIVEARQPLKGIPSAAQVDECCLAIAAAFGPSADKKSFKVYVSTARALLSCPMEVLIEACKEGFGRNGVYERVNAAMRPADSTEPKVGRPAGKGAGKTTAKPAAAAAANDSVIPKDGASPMHRWLVALTAMDNGALIVRDAKNNTMTAEDATALQAALKTCRAIVGKYTAAENA
jgi:hypothetical protein